MKMNPSREASRSEPPIEQESGREAVAVVALTLPSCAHRANAGHGPQTPGIPLTGAECTTMLQQHETMHCTRQE
jgi:hypothetical protein